VVTASDIDDRAQVWVFTDEQSILLANEVRIVDELFVEEVDLSVLAHNAHARF
jgi:hypothetical protein